MKKWHIQETGAEFSLNEIHTRDSGFLDTVLTMLLKNRGITEKEKGAFLSPPDPSSFTASDVGIDPDELHRALTRIHKALVQKESIIVYADYDADGVTAGTILWETLYALGARVMPYIPHRVEEGYGLSIKGIDAIRTRYQPTLIITVDHGISGKEKVEYAKKQGIDVIVTDHHVKPSVLPDCTIVHTTRLSGAGVSWFLAKELLRQEHHEALSLDTSELVALAAIGTIADLVPLVGPNRSLAKDGLSALNQTSRVGLLALLQEAGLIKGKLGPYDISHIIAPRLNAMGRLVHAMDALRLLSTKQEEKARLLAQTLGETNRERQQITIDTVAHALERMRGTPIKKLLFIADESYNPGVIGLVAGKLVEQYYVPSIVVSKGPTLSKASARSIPGFNIVEAIRSCSDLLVDVGGHPMAAGFTVETHHLSLLEERLVALAEQSLDEEKLTRVLRFDVAIPLDVISQDLCEAIATLAPYGFGNPEPVFVTTGVVLHGVRLVGAEGKHLKARVTDKASGLVMDAIAFGMGTWYPKLNGEPVDIAYTISMDTWNGNKRLQLKLKDIRIPEESDLA